MESVMCDRCLSIKIGKMCLVLGILAVLWGPLLWCMDETVVQTKTAVRERILAETSSMAVGDAPGQVVTDGVRVTSEDATVDKAPQRFSLLNIDLSNPNVRLGVLQAHQHLFSSGETMTSMAERTGAVAGINGDFFEIYGTGAPLGIVESEGQLWQSPASTAMLGVTSAGRLVIGTEAFAGSVRVGHVSYALHSVNRYADVKGNDLALFSPALGSGLLLPGDSLALLRPVRGSSSDFVVQSVQASSVSLPLLKDTWAIVGSGSAANWLTTTLTLGTHVDITERLLPDDDLVQAIGGGSILIRDGALSDEGVYGAADEQGPLTALGISRDGKQAIFVVCDGHQPLRKGMTHRQMASYLLTHGAYQAMLFDGGGSSEMVARLPGEGNVSVINSPSNGHERPVANGLFVYSTEKEAGPATSVVINAGQPLTLLTGTSIPVQSYALDALENPAKSSTRLHVEPENLATVVHGIIHAVAGVGRGLLVAEAGDVSTTLPLAIVDHLATLAVTPTNLELGQGQIVTFHVTGTAQGALVVQLPANAVHWSVTPVELGTIQSEGRFTASLSAVTVGTVTATVGGSSAVASVAVGDSAELVTSMTDLTQWGISDHYLNVFPRTVHVPGPHSVSTGSLDLSTGMPRLLTEAGSMELHYHFPHSQKVFHLDPYPNDPAAFQILPRNKKQVPDALGLWVKGDTRSVADGGTSSASGLLNLSIGCYEADNTPVVFHMGVITSDEWTLLKARLPDGLSYPLRINYVSIVVIDPPADERGELHLSDLQAFYPLQTLL